MTQLFNTVIGPERFDEAMSYVEKHRLYDHALSLWRESDKYEVRDYCSIVPNVTPIRPARLF